MSPHEIQNLVLAILGTIVFLGFLSLVIAGVILLIKRVLAPDGIGAGEKRTEHTATVRVLEKRSNLAAGLMTFYYISFEGLFEFKASKKVYKSVNVGDLVKITYEGEKLVDLSVIEKSTEISIPKTTISGRFSDKDSKNE